jgi:hypothetical protein
MHTVLAATAALVATAFAMLTGERYAMRRRRHELMWTISLAMFALGSVGLWLGAAIGWSEWTFKLFYLFGAILNVPFLALGTVYLLVDRRRADVTAAVVSLLAAFAAGIVVSTPILGLMDREVLPQGSAVFGPGPRIAAGVGSGVAALVIIGGALWSAARLLLARRRAKSQIAQPATGPVPVVPAGRLAAANLLIAGGTLVLSAGGILNSVVDAMDAFALSLVVGISVIFAGFLLTMSPTGSASAPPSVAELPTLSLERVATGTVSEARGATASR